MLQDNQVWQWFKRTDILLAWIAIALWAMLFFREYTAMDGIINVVSKASSSEPFTYQWVSQNEPLYNGFGVAYWVAFVVFLIFGGAFVISAWQNAIHPLLKNVYYKMMLKPIPKKEYTSPELTAINNLTSEITTNFKEFNNNLSHFEATMERSLEKLHNEILLLVTELREKKDDRS